jgi:hypothetical protein
MGRDNSEINYGCDVEIVGEGAAKWKSNNTPIKPTPPKPGEISTFRIIRGSCPTLPRPADREGR